MAEIQKLAKVISRIIGLKNEIKNDEAEELIKRTLTENFGLNFESLFKESPAEFDVILKSKSYSSEKLDLLGQLLFEAAHPFEDIPETDSILHKVLVIFKLIEEDHHMQSFDNLNKREMIDKFLNNRQYE